MPDPARAVTLAEFAGCLSAWRQRSGMTYEAIENAVGLLPPRSTRELSFRKSSLGEVFTGKHLPKRDLLIVLLEVMGVPAGETPQLLDAWQRIGSGHGTQPANAMRVTDYPARLLGVQAAIPLPGSPDAIPAYVERDFDRRLRETLEVDAPYGSFVILTGAPSVGKTRSLYEAVKAVVPDWWLIHPAGRREVADFAENPQPRSVVWLDGLETYLDGDGPPLNLPLMSRLRSKGVIIAATMWTPTYRQCMKLPAHAQDRRLIESATADIAVGPRFSDAERRRAEALAQHDGQLRLALSVTDMGIIQTLTGGPVLVNWWERREDPLAWAAVTAAADLHRLGMHAGVSADAVGAAFTSYLEPQEFAADMNAALAAAMDGATGTLQGVSAPLMPLGAGQAGYKVSEFLLQHVCRRRRESRLTPAVWECARTHMLRMPT